MHLGKPLSDYCLSCPGPQVILQSQSLPTAEVSLPTTSISCSAVVGNTGLSSSCSSGSSLTMRCPLKQQTCYHYHSLQCVTLSCPLSRHFVKRVIRKHRDVLLVNGSVTVKWTWTCGLFVSLNLPQLAFPFILGVILTIVVS